MTASAGIPTGPGVPAWVPPDPFVDRVVYDDLPGTIDAGTSSTTTLTLIRNNASNSNNLKLVSSQTGGRSTVEYVDEFGDGIARLVAHTALDPAAVAAGWRVYGRRATPRLDGNMFDNRYTVESGLDFTNIYGFGATWNLEAHDTDGNLWTDKSILKVYRDPTNSAVETSEFGRARTSGVGSNYLYRDLDSTETVGPLVRVTNDNASDDQIAFRLQQDAAQSALHIVRGSNGPAITIAGGGYIEYSEMTAPANGAADTARVYAVDNGAGKTQLVVKFSSGAAVVLATQP